MADYKIISSGEEGDCVFKYDGGLYIPSDEGNRDWIEYQKYLEEGGEVDPQEGE